jgi:hypothetical protein
MTFQTRRNIMAETSNAQKLAEAFDSLEERRRELLAAVKGINQAQADFKPAPDQWSIGEVLDHLCLSGKGTFARVKGLCDGTVEAPQLTGKDATDKFLAGVADVSKSGKAPAPKEIVPTGGKPVGELLSSLENMLTEAKKKITEYQDDDLSARKFPFHTFCDLDCYQWIKFHGAHEARHIPQIERIKASQGYPA